MHIIYTYAAKLVIVMIPFCQNKIKDDAVLGSILLQTFFFAKLFPPHAVPCVPCESSFLGARKHSTTGESRYQPKQREAA